MPASVQLGPHRDLEDAEVAILHEIVARASAAPEVRTYPWRSLHRAYVEVLGHHGIDENQDSTYLRFLFELRKRHKAGQPLDVDFQILLLEYGIQIQAVESSVDYDDEDDYTQSAVDGGEGSLAQASQIRVAKEPGDVTIALERYGRPVEDVAVASRQWIPTPRRSRRASFESIYDTADKDARAGPARRRPDSRASYSHVAEETGKISPGPELKVTDAHQPRPWEASMIANASSPAKSLVSTRPQSQVTLLDFVDNSQSPISSFSQALNVEGVNGDRARQVSSVSQKLASHRGNDSIPKLPPLELLSSDSDEVIRELRGDVRIVNSHGTRQPHLQKNEARGESLRDLVYRNERPRRDPQPTSRTSRKATANRLTEQQLVQKDLQMILKAQEFESARVRMSLHRILSHWLDKTYHVYRYQQDLEQQAAQWDARLLKQDSFKVWHSTVVDIRQMRATVRAREQAQAVLYAQQERYASDLRDKMLLRKALLHWAACTSEEVERVKVARQHLTRFKYFRAWREHTVAVENKVNRHVLAKFFHKWRQPSAKQQRNSLLVLDYYDDTLIKRFFLQWLWRSREKDIQSQRDAIIKRKTFTLLVERFRNIQESHQLVVQARQRAFLQSLQKESQDRIESLHFAETFDDQRILRPCLAALVRDHKLSSLAKTVSAKIDVKLVSRAFAQLKLQYQLEQKARDFDRQRLLRGVASSWKLHLREQMVVKRVNDRVATEYLYKWAVAERFKLYQRLRENRLKSRCLVRVIDHWLEQSQGLTEAYINFKRRQKERDLRSFMQLWWNKTRTRARHEAAAHARYEQNLKLIVLDSFKERLTKVRALEEQYLPNAVLWFKGRSTLKQWRQITKDSRKRKRHEAYVAVRRQVKQNLVRKCLTKWREEGKINKELQELGTAFQKQSMQSLENILLQEWQVRLQENQQREAEADEFRHRHLVKQALQTWKLKKDEFRDQTAVALEHDSEHSKRLAYRCLRTLHLRMMRIQDLNTGSAVPDFVQWSQRRHDRALLKLWFEKTLRRRGRAEADIPATARTRRFRNLLSQSQLRESSRVSAVPDFAGVLPPQPPPPPPRETAPLPHEDPSMTPAIPPPSTPSRRRFVRITRTPAPPPTRSALPVPARTAASVSAIVPAAAAGRELANPFNAAEVPATESRIRTTRAFGRSTARTLFGRIPERAPESFP